MTHVVYRGGSRKLLWEGHIGLESLKTTKRDAESVEGGEVWGGDLPPPQSTRGLGEHHKVPQRGLGGRAPAANDFCALHISYYILHIYIFHKLITSSNTDQFSKLFHRTLSNKVSLKIKDPIIALKCFDIYQLVSSQY